MPVPLTPDRHDDASAKQLQRSIGISIGTPAPKRAHARAKPSRADTGVSGAPSPYFRTA